MCFFVTNKYQFKKSAARAKDFLKIILSISTPGALRWLWGRTFSHERGQRLPEGGQGRLHVELGFHQQIFSTAIIKVLIQNCRRAVRLDGGERRTGFCRFSFLPLLLSCSSSSSRSSESSLSSLSSQPQVETQVLLLVRSIRGRGSNRSEWFSN